MLSNLSGRVGQHLPGDAKSAWSSLRGSATGERESANRTDRPEPIETELAVLGRATLFALATIAGTVGSGIGSGRPSENGVDLATGDGSADETTLGRRLRENGPVVLVPLAWSFATAAHLGRLETRTVVIAHLVMDGIITTFAAASWSEMSEGVLRAWKLVLLVGLGFTLLGTTALLGQSEDESTEEAVSGNETALMLTVLSWMLVPAAGLAYTGLRVKEDEAPRIYLAGAVLSVLGSLAYASAPADSPASARKLLGLTLANVGQTAGIVNAVYQY